MLPDIPEGYKLDGRFVLNKKLGEGGYGAVFDAQQLSVNRRCAIKLMRAEGSEDKQVMLQRFRAEAMATSRLQHPNTIVMYDFGVDEHLDVMYLAMEYLSGESLDSLIKRETSLPLDDALSVLNQIAASLQNAHDQGIVHRDIKPHNVMVLQRDPIQVKVIDFGIAHVLESTTQNVQEKLTSSGVLIGTPHYMAPEQIKGNDMDGRTDTYALGMCMYRMLTGRTPFRGSSPIEIVCQHLVDVPKPVSEYASGLHVPLEFEQELLKSIEKKKEDRHDSVVLFARELTNAARYRLTWSMSGALHVQSIEGAPAPRAVSGTQQLRAIGHSKDLPDSTLAVASGPRISTATMQQRPVIQQVMDTPNSPVDLAEGPAPTNKKMLALTVILGLGVVAVMGLVISLLLQDPAIAPAPSQPVATAPSNAPQPDAPNSPQAPPTALEEDSSQAKAQRVSKEVSFKALEISQDVRTLALDQRTKQNKKRPTKRVKRVTKPASTSPIAASSPKPVVTPEPVVTPKPVAVTAPAPKPAPKPKPIKPKPIKPKDDPLPIMGM